MQKALIISYFFPPCNLTAANRIGTWEKYFPENGIYPIVITRNWTGKELTEAQRLANSGDKKRVVQQANSEIHYLPYHSSLRDLWFIKGKNNPVFAVLSKIATLFYLIFQNFSLKFIPYNNLYFEARKLLIQDKTIKTLIISGNPFEQFYFGYLLKKEFPHIKWIADYRDDWTTTELIKNRSLLQKGIHFLEKRSEKKWLSNANLFTSVSSYYVEKIGNFINKEGRVLYNGYNEDLLEKKHVETKDSFIVTYNGSLYATQKIEIFISAFVQLVNEFSSQINIKLHLPGLAYNQQQAQRIHRLLKGYESYYLMTDRIPKSEVIDIQLKSDVLLMVAHENLKGIPSSKIFEYIGLRKEILLCPSDKDVLDEIVGGGLGQIANTKESCFEILKTLAIKKIKREDFTNFNETPILNYSGKGQVTIFAKILSEL